MRPGRRGLLATALLCLTTTPTTAQSPQQVECARLAGAAAAGLGDESCFFLAGTLVGALGTQMILQRDLQPADEGGARAAGSLAQGEAVPTAQPMAIGGGSLSAVGSDAGSDAITALTFNPTIFFGAASSGEELARNSRLADVTVFFPMDELDRDDDGDVDYFGLRMRVNFTGLGAGSELWAAARRLQALTVSETTATERLDEVLSALPVARLGACVESLRDVSSTTAERTEACGEDVRRRLDAQGYEQFRQSLVPLRTQADSRYFGLDVRLDFGDPTLGAVPDAQAVAINAGIAFGRQLVGADALAPSTGIRFRAGVRYTELVDVDETSFALDGGLGFALRRPVDVEKALTLTGGFEFRFGGVDEALDAAFQSDFVVFRAALSVPMTDQVGITMSFGRPLVGDEISQTLSVTGDWRLLLPLLPSPG